MVLGIDKIDIQMLCISLLLKCISALENSINFHQNLARFQRYSKISLPRGCKGVLIKGKRTTTQKKIWITFGRIASSFGCFSQSIPSPEKRHIARLRNVHRHDEGNKLLNTCVDGTTLLHCLHNGGEVVICQDPQ